jgi:hypothetical protein
MRNRRRKEKPRFACGLIGRRRQCAELILPHGNNTCQEAGVYRLTSAGRVRRARWCPALGEIVEAEGGIGEDGELLAIP